MLYFFGKVFSIPLATFVGMLVGGQLRYILTGEETQVIRYQFKTKDGRTMTNAPVATKFYPGMIMSLVGKPRWFFAFAGGIIAGTIIPDKFERIWLERVLEPLIMDRISGGSS
jgi:hypothetical protein